jgi:hypothetical protein
MMMLGLQAGHRRNEHTTALRGDAVAAQALGMARVVSEDALRRALKRIEERTAREALDRQWILDIVASYVSDRVSPIAGRPKPSTGLQAAR